MSAWSESKQWEEAWIGVGDIVGGSQAAAKQVKHRQTGEIAFLKILSRQTDPERRARFFREATAYDTCQHGGMLRLIQSNAHHHGSSSHRLFIVTEFNAGPTLTQQIDSGHLPTFEGAAATLARLLDVIGYCHQESWVHRDIKPDNIVLRNGSVSLPVLLDFGLSYKDGLALDFQTEHGQEIGNRFLRLPELSAGSMAKQDVRSDLAFLGGILFYMLTGAAPSMLMDAEGRMPHQRTQFIASLTASVGRGSPLLLGFFDRSFSQKLTGRFSSASEMKQALLKITTEQVRADSMSSTEAMQAIIAGLNSQANQQLVKLKALYDRAMGVIKGVHQEFLGVVAPTYTSYQTGYVNFTDGLKNVLGFTHFATHDHRFAPLFHIKLVGEEIVVYVDDEIIHRTEVEAPVFDDSFKERIRAIYAAGLKKLIDTPL